VNVRFCTSARLSLLRETSESISRVAIVAAAHGGARHCAHGSAAEEEEEE